MLDTRDVIGESVVNTVRTVEVLGNDEYKTYRKSVINDRTRTIHDPIKNNSSGARHARPKKQSMMTWQFSPNCT
jgi:hypothetical protein